MQGNHKRIIVMDIGDNDILVKNEAIPTTSNYSNNSHHFIALFLLTIPRTLPPLLPQNPQLPTNF